MHVDVYLSITLMIYQHFDGLMQERRNSSALAMELRLFFTKTLIYKILLQLNQIIKHKSYLKYEALW